MRRRPLVAAVSAVISTLSGVVTNEEGAPLAGVKVTLYYWGTSATTDAEGRYTLMGIEPGGRWFAFQPETTFDFPYIAEWQDGTRGAQAVVAPLMELRIAGITLVGGPTTLSTDVEDLWLCEG